MSKSKPPNQPPDSQPPKGSSDLADAFAASSAAERTEVPIIRYNRPPVWPWLALLAALAAILVWRTLSPRGGSDADDNGRRHPAVGTKFTQVALKSLGNDGRPIAAADLAGKVTLINFWGPWCGACVVEFPHLAALERHFRSQRDFQFLSVSTGGGYMGDQELRESTAEFLQQHKAHFPVFEDPDFATQRALAQAAQLEGFGYPTTVLIGRDGTIRGLWVGYTPGDERSVRAAVDEALAVK